MFWEVWEVLESDVFCVWEVFGKCWAVWQVCRLRWEVKVLCPHMNTSLMYQKFSARFARQRFDNLSTFIPIKVDKLSRIHLVKSVA